VVGEPDDVVADARDLNDPPERRLTPVVAWLARSVVMKLLGVADRRPFDVEVILFLVGRDGRRVSALGVDLKRVEAGERR
jgi:hypothetical protein